MWADFARPKDVQVRSKKLRDAARGQSCIACGTCDDTIVGAHRNERKGKSMKVHDFWLLDLCYRCHTEYDQGTRMTQAERRDFFDSTYPKQIARWEARGLIYLPAGVLLTPEGILESYRSGGVVLC